MKIILDILYQPDFFKRRFGSWVCLCDQL
jgi:hypothetical protein